MATTKHGARGHAGTLDVGAVVSKITTIAAIGQKHGIGAAS